ncbi:MAG: DUF362 domain-containing protein [Planctomycetes bacterium]|nr:DUF362 domain-containing protein [Planctomycetota bacterium]
MFPRVLKRHTVSLHRGNPTYPDPPPYSPAVPYPEYPFASPTISATSNWAYSGVREALRLLQLDAGEFGTANWNPLGPIVRPGHTVVLKPNFVRHFRETHSGDGDCIITHGSVIRAVLDYVYRALEGRGRIVIADAPQNDADFAEIRRIVGLDEIQEFYRQHATLEVEVYDLRSEMAHKTDGVIVGHTPLVGDPSGYVQVNLGQHSAFAEVKHLCDRLYGAEYDTRELRRHHHDDVHEYLIARTVLDADVVIGIPKLKTHKKTGLTVNLKNLVGINGNKNWLPHHREGTPNQGGDQFEGNGLKRAAEQVAVEQFKKLFPYLGPLRRLMARPAKALGKWTFGDTNTNTVRSGNWYGNDTTWRMVHDLNRILLYADAQGQLHQEPVREFFSVVDGIVAGEGNGPLDPTPKQTGLIVAGGNPLAVDLACARLMGFDYERIPMLKCALDEHSLPLASFGHEDVVGRSDDPRFDVRLADMNGSLFRFEPHFGWKGHVEIGAGVNETSAFA